MPVNRTPLSANATREEKLAALPKYQRHSAAPATETRLTRLADDAMSTLADLDTELTDLADEFAVRFEQEDARAAARERISATAKAHRNKPRG